MEGGMFNSLRLVGVVNILNEKQKAKQQSWYCASEYNYSDGFFDNPQHFNRFNFFTKYHGKVSNKSFYNSRHQHCKANGMLQDKFQKEPSSKD